MDTPRQVKRNEKKVSEKKGKNPNKKLAINSLGKLNVQFLPETNKIVYNQKIPWIYSRSFQTIEREGGWYCYITVEPDMHTSQNEKNNNIQNMTKNLCDYFHRL
jgi:hypothetical protein